MVQTLPNQPPFTDPLWCTHAGSLSRNSDDHHQQIRAPRQCQMACVCAGRMAHGPTEQDIEHVCGGCRVAWKEWPRHRNKHGAGWCLAVVRHSTLMCTEALLRGSCWRNCGMAGTLRRRLMLNVSSLSARSGAMYRRVLNGCLGK